MAPARFQRGFSADGICLRYIRRKSRISMRSRLDGWPGFVVRVFINTGIAAIGARLKRRLALLRQLIVLLVASCS